MDTNTRPDFQTWREGREYDRSFDHYRREFPEVREYVCVVLSPEHKLFHLPQTPLLETDDLGEACVFVYNHFKATGVECAVYQERSAGYREIYQHKSYHDKRDRQGRFAKA